MAPINYQLAIFKIQIASIAAVTAIPRKITSLFLSNLLLLSSRRFLIVLIILYSLIGKLMGDCPNLCECKWKSGKESVLCLNANLSTIPSRLDGGTQILDLTGNEIVTIPHDTFASENLLNLQKIYLAKCRLRQIERYAFRKLANLVELDLSYNQLTMVPSQSFDAVPELRDIKLSGNPISRIFNDAFSRVPQLVRLELSDCKISIVEPRAFLGIEATIEWLKLDGNKIMDIQADTLTSLSNLHGLELARNPWNCSCQLRPLREWMMRENIPYGIPPICRMPVRLSGKTWDKIELDEFACVPQIIATDTKAHGVEGRNVTMSCFVDGVPEPNVRWIVKNRVVANLSGETTARASTSMQGRKTYMANLLRNASNLTILTADIQDAGIYTCAAENKAGRVEASVTLAVSRRPPEAPLGVKVVLVCVLIALVFVVGSSFAAICFFTLRRKRKMRLWHAQAAGSESYEKIEMGQRKPEMRPFRREENGYIRGGHGENGGIAIVNPTKKNGDYRNVPTDDDGTGYEDNNETGCTSFTIQRKEHHQPQRWKGTTLNVSPVESKKAVSTTTVIENADLHIPRLIDLGESTSTSISSQVDAATRQTTTFTHPKPTWSNQMVAKKPIPLKIVEHHPPLSAYGSDDVHSSVFCSSNSPDADLFDQKYPDLLDVSKYTNSGKNVSSHVPNSALCTLPRKLKNSTKYFKNSSDSQSPLLAECSSKYGSSTLGDGNFFGDFSSGRRFSAESYTNYSGVRTTSQRSNSFLNLVQSANKSVSTHRRNPSLPSSPVRETHQRSLSSAATPLLDFSTLMTSRGVIVPSTSSVSAYDYHAAQLERFLEEYRNLQEQLCKMKETCDSIRKKETPLRNALGHSAQFADPMMFDAAIVASNMGVDHHPSHTNPNTSLKTKAILPGQPPDPPPYWLHRNAMLKRLNDSQSEFFQS